MSERTETGLWGPDGCDLAGDSLLPMDDLERSGAADPMRKISTTSVRLVGRSRRMRARMAAIEEAIGEGWVSAAGGDLALAIRMKTRSLEGLS